VCVRDTNLLANAKSSMGGIVRVRRRNGILRGMSRQGNPRIFRTMRTRLTRQRKIVANERINTKASTIFGHRLFQSLEPSHVLEPLLLEQVAEDRACQFGGDASCH
jgi:hypothetical protein